MPTKKLFSDFEFFEKIMIEFNINIGILGLIAFFIGIIVGYGLIILGYFIYYL